MTVLRMQNAQPRSARALSDTFATVAIPPYRRAYRDLAVTWKWSGYSVMCANVGSNLLRPQHGQVGSASLCCGTTCVRAEAATLRTVALWSCIKYAAKEPTRLEVCSGEWK